MHKVLLLPGDGIGPEVTAEAQKVLERMRDNGFECEIETGLIGGAAVDKHGVPLPPETLEQARAADGILLGAVGGPQYEKLERAIRPEKGLLAIRKELGLFANLRPAKLLPGLESASALRADVVRGMDVMIVRELTGGIYFGEPRGERKTADGREAFNTMVYSEAEVTRIARIAFQVARTRNKRVCSVDKANVLEVSEMWRDIVTQVAQDYSDVNLSHMYVDNAAMQIANDPNKFDVIVTSNLFGDILSDLAAALTGSLGLLPSASLNTDKMGLYEPVHGSAPDIAGKGIANPVGAILSLAMLLRHSLGELERAARIESAVDKAIAMVRTADIVGESDTSVSTNEMGDAIVRAL